MRNRKLAAVFMISAFMAMAPGAVSAQSWRDIDVDIAQNMVSFVASESPVLANGFPAYGNAFIIQGYIYPAGTLGSSNGVLATGEPEFPELVIGEWTCRGWFVGNGVATTSGPWVVSQQLYDLGSMPGSETVITDGYELADMGVSVARAITGGTGRYDRASGEQRQMTLGFNASGALNLRVSIRVK